MCIYNMKYFKYCTADVESSKLDTETYKKSGL